MEIAPIQIVPPAVPSQAGPSSDTSNHKRLFFGAIGFTFVVLVIGGYYYFLSQVKPPPAQPLATYFAYTEQELAVLRDLSSREVMAADALYDSDQLAFDLVSEYTLRSDFTEEVSKVYSYLTVAQRDVAFLSYNERGEFSGTLQPITHDILCTFFSTDCASIPDDSDQYSKALASLVHPR